MHAKRKALLLSLMLSAAPATAWALGGGAGCADLPEHDRAVGALEGMTGACDMSVEQARRILAGDARQAPDPAGGVATGRSVAPRHRRHRVAQPPM